MEKREGFRRFDHDTRRLPRPASDLSTSLGLAPNDDGDLVVSIFLMGGCIGQYDVVVGGDGANDTPTQYRCAEVSDGTLVYDPTHDMFEDRARMPRKRYRHDSVVSGGDIWVVGGRDGNDEVVREIDVYDPPRDKWITVALLPPEFAVSDHAMWAHGDSIFIAGGYDRNRHAVPYTLEINAATTLLNHGGFDGAGVRPPVELVFERRADMGTARGDVSGLNFGGTGYAIGGFSHEDGFCQPLATVEAYDPHTRQWIQMNDLTEGRASAAVIKYGGDFYVLGGETRVANGEGRAVDGGDCGGDVKVNRLAPRRRTFPVNSVEMYDPKEGTEGQWHHIMGTLPDNRQYRFALSTMPGTEVIYLFGGVRSSKNSTGGSPKDAGEKDKCGGCLPLSDIIIEYSDVWETYYVTDMWLRRLGSTMLIAVVALVAWCFAGNVYDVWKRLKEERIPEHEGCDEVGLGGIGLVDMRPSRGGPFRDAEVL